MSGFSSTKAENIGNKNQKAIEAKITTPSKEL